MPSLVPSISGSWRRYPITTPVSCLLVLFLVLFPKGGVKVGPIPLTWGYMLLGLTLPPLILIRLSNYPFRLRFSTVAVVGSLLPFDILFCYSFRQNGMSSPGIFISDLSAFWVLPFAFLIVYPHFLSRIDGVSLERLLRFCMLGAALFGIFLFVQYPLTGKFLEVPYLTVNADDYGLIETTKHIARGAFLKLVSTYNNGNLYGVATLILLPLYDHFEKKTWRRTTLKLALILTLSRTVWLGLIVDQVLSLLRILVASSRSFPRFRAGPAIKQGVFTAVTAGAIVAGLTLTFGNIAFLFDPQLGGRTTSITASVQNTTWLPSMPISAFLEVVYASALSEYGILGLVSIILIFTFPILLFLMNRRIADSPVRMAAFKGLILYMILAGVDGAINLIPVMAFYWFAYMIFLEGWPAPLNDAAPVFAASGGTIEVPTDGVARPEIRPGPSSQPNGQYGVP